jgi:xylulokinase
MRSDVWDPILRRDSKVSRFTVGIDLGTTGTKAILFSPEMGVVAETTRAVDLFSPSPGFAEADPNQWKANAVDSIRELMATSGVSPNEIMAVSATGMVPAIVLTDENGAPLYRAMLQNDARATEEIGELALELRDLDLVALTGSPLSQQSLAPTLSWLQRHAALPMKSLRYVTGSYDWLLMAFGADAHVEANWALESGLFSIDGEPIQKVFGACGVSPDVIPPIRHSSDVVGHLSAEVAELTGLIAGTPLVVGGADHVLSAFGAGVTNPGDCLIKLGGAGDILAASDKIVVDERLYLDAHPVPGQWLPNGCMATSGSLIRWFQRLTAGPDLARLDDAAAQVPPGEILCLPYFLGEKSPVHDPRLRGAFLGLHLGHSQEHLFRSILEAIAFGFRQHIDIFRSIGIDVTKVVVTNGGSKSKLWKQIHADVLQMPLSPVVNHPGGALGAAFAGALGVGLLHNWTDIERYIQLGAPVIPNLQHADVYNDAYEEWSEFGTITTNLAHRLSDRSIGIDQ